MTRRNPTKLNRLLSAWPTGLVKTLFELRKSGYSRQLINFYVQSSWLKMIASGAYLRFNEEPSIYGVMNALNEQLNLSLHLGGSSALEYYGYSHYVYFNKKEIYYLYVSDSKDTVVPSWVNSLPMKINTVNKHLFKSNLALVVKVENKIKFVISRPERAILELLAFVPNKYSFEFANLTIEGLQSLDPVMMQRLLEQCSSIKVKRLFLYLAEENNLACFKRLDLESIELGKGKRKIGEGGVYNKKYRLSVPLLNLES